MKEREQTKLDSFYLMIDYDAEKHSVFMAEESSSGVKEKAKNKKEILAAIEKYFDFYLQ